MQAEMNISDVLVRDELFSEVFKHSPLGLIIVDDDRKMVRANDYLFNKFRLQIVDVTGERFGNVFHCNEVMHNSIHCGEGDQCSECKFRNGVNNVMDEKAIIEGMELSHQFVVNGRKTTRWFSISASPITIAGRGYALLSFIDITDRIKKEEELKALGMTDELTGLYNRRCMLDLLEKKLNQMKGKDLLTVAILDIDDFKRINDTYGHSKGDKILRTFAQTLKSNTRDADCVGRYGGEEFIAVFNGSSISETTIVMKRIQKALGDVILKEEVGTVTFSCGLAEIGHKGLMSYSTDEIISEADKLLYDVKHHGKNNVKGVRLM